jgi:hypothetical protein
MLWIFDQHFVRSYRSHAVIEAISAAGRFSFDVIQGTGMHDCARRPRGTIDPGHARNLLQRGCALSTKQACALCPGVDLGNVIPGDDPGAGNGIFAEFHQRKKTTTLSDSQLLDGLFRVLGENLIFKTGLRRRFTGLANFPIGDSRYNSPTNPE